MGKQWWIRSWTYWCGSVNSRRNYVSSLQGDLKGSLGQGHVSRTKETGWRAGMLAMNRAELLLEESMQPEPPDAPASYSARGGLGFRTGPCSLTQMTSRQDIMHCHFKAGASSTYTRRKTFFRNREEEGKNEGEDSQILEKRRGNIRGPMSSQSSVQRRMLHICHHHRNRLCWRSCLRPGCPGLASLSTLEISFQAFSLKSRCNPF